MGLNGVSKRDLPYLLIIALYNVSLNTNNCHSSSLQKQLLLAPPIYQTYVYKEMFVFNFHVNKYISTVVNFLVAL